jgi:hypothetical protein
VSRRKNLSEQDIDQIVVAQEEWLTHVIQERIELEEAAFGGVKRDLAAKVG